MASNYQLWAPRQPWRGPAAVGEGCISLFWVPLLILILLLIRALEANEIKIKIRRDNPKKWNAAVGEKSEK
jgi:hypothetical protein